jgi:hypothetical protein
VISLMHNLPRREALITVPATVPPSVLPFGSPWWTQRRWWESNGLHNRRTHRTRFLSETSLRCGCPIGPREAKGVDRRQTCTLSRAIDAVKLGCFAHNVPLTTHTRPSVCRHRTRALNGVRGRKGLAPSTGSLVRESLFLSLW